MRERMYVCMCVVHMLLYVKADSQGQVGFPHLPASLSVYSLEKSVALVLGWLGSRLWDPALPPSAPLPRVLWLQLAQLASVRCWDLHARVLFTVIKHRSSGFMPGFHTHKLYPRPLIFFLF